jgi:hypothetical protein
MYMNMTIVHLDLNRNQCSIMQLLALFCPKTQTQLWINATMKQMSDLEEHG